MKIILRSLCTTVAALLILFLQFSAAAPLQANDLVGVHDHDLTVGREDLLIEYSSGEGYELWIRKKAAISSVLLVESVEDLAPTATVYSLRNPQYHPVNGDEKRLINGTFISPEQKIYSLVDSTTEVHPKLGRAFHIYIPPAVVYGYPWTRSGRLQIRDGVCFVIRTFAKPYADYTGPYEDRIFRLAVMKPREPSPPAAPQPLQASRQGPQGPQGPPGPPGVSQAELESLRSRLRELERMGDSMKGLYSKLIFLMIELNRENGGSGVVTEVLSSPDNDSELLSDSLDYSLRNNKENGYVLDPSDDEKIEVYISRVFRFAEENRIKTGDIGYVFRNEDEPIGYIRFFVGEEEITASLIELVAADKELRAFDKILLDLK